MNTDRLIKGNLYMMLDQDGQQRDILFVGRTTSPEGDIMYQFKGNDRRTFEIPESQVVSHVFKHDYHVYSIRP